MIPFEDCAAHVGEKGWITGVISDQVRIYASDLQPEEIKSRILNDAVNTALGVFDKANVTVGKYGEWDKVTLSYFEASGHTLLFRDIDFYVRSFDSKSVVFVFLHAVGGGKELIPILDSFRWPKSPPLTN